VGIHVVLSNPEQPVVGLTRLVGNATGDWDRVLDWVVVENERGQGDCALGAEDVVNIPAISHSDDIYQQSSRVSETDDS
jgi:hypothetical protein